MTRFSPRSLAFLTAALLAGCSALGSDTNTKTAVAAKPQPLKTIASDIDGNVRQAQLLRLAGKPDEAIQILSQLTLVAPDDARVVGEYGKALAQKGRAQDATQFLRRAAELAPNDWTIYSAMGVAYDQASDPVNARAAYEHALSIRPGEPSVLNNFALSRLLAKDTEGARSLIAQAKASGAPGDEKIARNVALINQMAPAPIMAEVAKPAKAASAAPQLPPVAIVPQAQPQIARNAPPIPVVETPVTGNEAPRDASDVARRLASQAPVAEPGADGAPRSLVPANESLPAEINQAAIVLPQRPAERRVVMQAVPFDPLAGPVKPRPTAKPKAVAAAKKVPGVQKAEVPSLRIANENY